MGQAPQHDGCFFPGDVCLGLKQAIPFAVDYAQSAQHGNDGVLGIGESQGRGAGPGQDLFHFPAGLLLQQSGGQMTELGPGDVRLVLAVQLLGDQALLPGFRHFGLGPGRGLVPSAARLRSGLLGLADRQIGGFAIGADPAVTDTAQGDGSPLQIAVEALAALAGKHQMGVVGHRGGKDRFPVAVIQQQPVGTAFIAGAKVRPPGCAVKLALIGGKDDLLGQRKRFFHCDPQPVARIPLGLCAAVGVWLR